MRRRQVLGLALLPLAGCVTGDADGDSTPGPGSTPTATPAETPTGTPSPTPPPEPPTYDIGETADLPGVPALAVESVAVQASAIHHHLWREHLAVDGGQLLLIDVRVADEEDWDDGPAFRARVDGETIDSELRRATAGWYVVSVPVADYEAGEVALEVGPDDPAPAWRLTDDHLGTLAAAPDLRVLEAAVVERDAETAMEIAVENVGDRDGTFRGITVSKHVADGDADFRFPVPVGETATHVVRNSVVERWDPDDEFVHDVDVDTRSFAVGYA